MKKETIICDIDGCNSEHDVENQNMQVIFTTDQTEGRSCTPYFSFEEIDICSDCLKKIIDTKKYIIATGAQGYNQYYLK